MTAAIKSPSFPRRRESSDFARTTQQEQKILRRFPAVGKDILTYDDLLQIVELIKSAEAFSEFHLKIGDIELDLRKADAGGGALIAPVASTEAPVVEVTAATKPAPPPAHQPAAASVRPEVEIPAG